MLGGNAFECRDHLVNVTTIGDAYRDANSMFERRAAGLVNDLAITENAIGNRNLDIVAREQARAAQADVRDDATLA